MYPLVFLGPLMLERGVCVWFFWLFLRLTALKDQKKQLPCAAYLNGEYGFKDIYAGVPVIIGKNGVEKIIEIKLNNDEKNDFDKSIGAVKDLFDAAKKIDSSL